jgi:hypothetical protein
VSQRLAIYRRVGDSVSAAVQQDPIDERRPTIQGVLGSKYRNDTKAQTNDARGTGEKEARTTHRGVLSSVHTQRLVGLVILLQSAARVDFRVQSMSAVGYGQLDFCSGTKAAFNLLVLLSHVYNRRVTGGRAVCQFTRQLFGRYRLQSKHDNSPPGNSETDHYEVIGRCI